jgi:hypothetical protein
MEEIFKSIVGYEGLYEISNLQNVKSLNRVIIRSNGQKVRIKERILKPAIGGRGYYSVVLCNDVRQRSECIHILMAKTFIPNPENKKEVNHINAITTDNRIENLEWCTHKENMTHAKTLGLIKYNKGEKHYSSKLKNIDIMQIRSLSGIKPHYQIAKMFNVDKSQISRIINRKIWNHI